MFTDINHLLHAERGERLKLMPKAKVMLSAGCAGTWYFNWIEECHGHVERHIGLEYYSPRPDNLPPNVEWIANTVADMHGVASSSVDLVFSGQNLEHIWPDEAIGFFLEAARVTREGGYLVIDSPNRSATKKMRWSHPEHTVEFTALEACRAMVAAGFDVTAVEGIWQCLDQLTGVALPHNAGSDQEVRISEGRRDPDNAFIWWVEARRADRAPELTQLRDIVINVFERAWDERSARWLELVGTRHDDGVSVVAGQGGPMIYGPYMPLPAGDYSVTFRCVDGSPWAEIGACDVMIGGQVTASQPLVTDLHGTAHATIAFSLPEMTFALQFRVISNGILPFHAMWPELHGASTTEILRTRGL